MFSVVFVVGLMGRKSGNVEKVMAFSCIFEDVGPAMRLRGGSGGVTSVLPQRTFRFGVLYISSRTGAKSSQPANQPAKASQQASQPASQET